MNNNAVSTGISGLLARVVKLAAIFPLLLLAGCDQGDGPTPIPGTPAPPPPPAGACDPTINFEDECDPATIINFNGGATTVIDNPDQNEANPTNKVARMQKFPDQVFGGTKLTVPDPPIDFSQGEFYLVKVWSPREVRVAFKLEEEGNPEGGLTRELTHPGGSEWQELCFDFTGQSVPPPVINLTIIFDNGVLGRADTDPDNWTFFYDEIDQVRQCPPPPGTPIDPDATLFSSSGAPDLVIPDDYAERSDLGSGSVIDDMYVDDETFSPVLSVWSGSSTGANVARVGFIGFPRAFLRPYLDIDFKVKGMPNQVIFVSLYEDVEALRINLTSSGLSEALDDGWFQVSIPVETFADVRDATGIVFESDDTSPDQFRMLLTDIGFSGVNGGLVSNPDFEAGKDPWLAGVGGPIGDENVIVDPDDADNMVYFVDVTAAGAPFAVNLSQRGIFITPDETYTLTFKARSNVARTMLAGIGLSGGSFANVNQSVNLTTEWQTYTLTLTAAGFGDGDSRVLFDMGAEVGEVYIDDVSLFVAVPQFDGGLVRNADFEWGTIPWLRGIDVPAPPEDVIEDALNPGNFVYFRNVTAADPGQPFLVNLSQRGITITPDETYTLTFSARSNVSRTMLAGIGLSGGDFSNTVAPVNLTTAWQDYTLELTATGFGDADSRVLFDMNAENGEVYIDNVRLVVAPEPAP